MYGIFTADELYASADKLLLTFVSTVERSCTGHEALMVLFLSPCVLRLIQGDVAAGKDLIIDDVSIQPLPTNCDELILFGNMELGHVRFWDE
jgi:hypothetical protein